MDGFKTDEADHLPARDHRQVDDRSDSMPAELVLLDTGLGREIIDGGDMHHTSLFDLSDYPWEGLEWDVLEEFHPGFGSRGAPLIRIAQGRPIFRLLEDVASVGLGEHAQVGQ